jgi:hypothetical protein
LAESKTDGMVDKSLRTSEGVSPRSVPAKDVTPAGPSLASGGIREEVQVSRPEAIGLYVLALANGRADLGPSVRDLAKRILGHLDGKTIVYEQNRKGEWRERFR